MSEYDYTGDKTKNYFTAYLQKCVRWKRKNYLQRKAKINNMEKSLEENLYIKYDMTTEEMLELYYKEELLLKEQNGEYPKWNELSDRNLTAALLLLREDEKRLIYQHVFEEKTFKEMAISNGMTKEKTEGSYYYALRKIRKMMEVSKHGF